MVPPTPEVSLVWGDVVDTDYSAVEFPYTVENNTDVVTITITSTDADIDDTDVVNSLANPVVINLTDLNSGESVTLTATVDGKTFTKTYTMA